MLKSVLSAFAVVVLGGVAAAQEPPKLPPPTKEHEWLNQMVGEWDTQLELFMEPGKPPLTAKGTATAKSLGGYWLVMEGKSEFGGMPMSFIQTLGYDPAKKKYVGTAVDSMMSHLWQYTGSVDGTGKVLLLETEGPCPMKGGKLTKFKESIEMKSPDHSVFTSQIEDESGKWVTMMVATSKRKK